MPPLIEQTVLPGVLIVTPTMFRDSRGFFLQTYQAREYREAGIHDVFVQDNLSRSCRGTLRGLHYQLRNPQSKLVSVLSGTVLDVVVDIRRGSPSFGKWVAVELSEENRKQLFVPKGFAHGFQVLSEYVDFAYKCGDFYAPGDEYGIRWDDPALNVGWASLPDCDAVISEKDNKLPCLANVPPEHLPTCEQDGERP